jgi:minor fimbrial subunit
MAKYNLLAAATLGLMAASYDASAADSVTLNITGNVVASPCTVNGGSGTINVDLTNIQATTLASAGSSSTDIPFSIPLTACPAGTSNVQVAFSGTPDPVAGANYYKNTGTATNVAVGITEVSTGTLKGTGTTIIQPVVAGVATVNLKAKAYSSAGGAMPGTISSVVTTTITYQ